MVVPVATPVTTPVALTVAVAGVDDAQVKVKVPVPDAAADDKEIVLPIHTVEAPVIFPAVGFVTVTKNAAEVVEQPLPSVTV